MRPGSKKFGTILLSVLVFSAFACQTYAIEERRGGGQWRLFPRDTAHWFGWIGFALLAVSATYSALKRGFPQNIRLWLTVHCVLGVLSLIFTSLHMVNKVFHMRTGMVLSLLTFVIMAIIVIGGIMGRYLKTTILSRYWKTLHVPLTALFYVLLGIHMLAKMEALAI